MAPLTTLVRGFAGKPLHPPLTDVSIGAYTAGVAMLVAGALGFEQPAMATGAVLAIGVGLIAAVPTIITGLVDLFAVPADAPARTLGWLHLTAMASATGFFVGAFAVQLDGYRAGTILTSALVLGLVAELTLIVGGYLGGALTYVYGLRVLNRPDTSVSDALVPGRTDHPKPQPTSRPTAPRGHPSSTSRSD
jgi:uncharacterized membrane protein